MVIRYGSEMGYCMMNVLYTDEVHELCPGSFKILRKWIAYDMCEAGSDGCCNDDENPRTHYQLIKVMDLTPITFETYTQNTYTVSTKPFTCTMADVTLPEPIIENYGCSDGYEYVVGYCSDGTGIFENFDNITYNSTTNRYTIYDLPEGETCVRYRLTDECGNVSEGTLTVLVVDNIPPIAVCDEHTVATVGTDCTARIYAETFDDGSFDNCTDVTFTVAKMNGSTVGTFGPYVTYSSSDVGNTRTVVMQVTDENGLSNTCMVSVYIDDKIGPTIVCPDDVTVDCDVNPYDVTLTGGDAEYWDNCSATLTYTDNGTLNQCNVGTITRTWTVTDNGGRTATCTQYVTVENNDPFNMLSSNWPADRTNLVGCSNADTDPASTGEPDLSDDGYCSMVAATYKDRTFNVVSGACYKILRDWTVIDWCQYNDHSPEYLGLAGHPYVGMWTHTQVIMVNDTNDPEFTSSCDNVEVCAYNSNCTGDVSLTATATDECTPDDELVYTYLVTGGTTSVNYSGTTNTFEKANMALGTYYITWTVEDKCGNLAHCSYTFVVEDCKNPTPLCYSEITTVVMPSTTPRMVSVTARDFDRGSTDNCTEGSTCGSCETDLRFSFSGTDPYDSIRVFDESNVGLNTLDMWVWDEAGNRDYCTVTLYVQDNVSGSGSLVAGLVQTEDDQSVSDVNVSAEDMVGHESFGSESGSTGLYQFDLPQSTNYKLTANKNDDYLNGLTTLDIVLIQKHLLGIKKLGSPYKILAADANFDSKVSASDLVQLRNLILGKTESLSNRGPWGFVNSNYEFVDQYNPWEESTDEMYYIVLPDLSSDQLENDFTALKIGDVNNSVVLNSTSGLINPRSTVNLEFDDQMIEKGQSIEIPFYLTDMNDIEGMQFSLDFNSSVLNIESVTGQEIALDDNYYNIKDSKLNLSWNRLTEGQIDVTKPLFTIRFNTVAGGLLSNAINLDNSISAEAYDDNLTVNGISLKVRNGIDDVFKIYQNTPNPFTNETEIGFVLPEAGNVNITVYDITGKVLFTKSSDFDKGFNSVNVSRDDLNSASGVLYYKIENGVNSAVKKMVLMAK
ncbi:MAG: T9SS type A sorting domain-containing protein [Saprospiraceae bacterium]